MSETPAPQALSPTMTVRKATASDIPALTANIMAMAQESEGRKLDLATLSAGIRRVFEEPALGTYWIANSATGEVIASCLMTVEWSDWNNAPYVWFQSVYIAPAWRGKGVFAEMMKTIEADARQSGACELRLYVETNNARAIRAYEKCDFISGHYQVMEKRLY